MASLIGKYVHLKDNGEHLYAGHHGWIVAESKSDDEYHIAGGSISVFGSGMTPVFCRKDFTIPKKQPDNSEALAYINSLII